MPCSLSSSSAPVFAGAVARYLVDQRVTLLTRGSLPWGTTVNNASGTLLVGLLAVVAGIALASARTSTSTRCGS